jgi:hypothetical protein
MTFPHPPSTSETESLGIGYVARGHRKGGPSEEVLRCDATVSRKAVLSIIDATATVVTVRLDRPALLRAN